MCTCMPSDSTCAQAGCGLGMPSTSMRQARQAATGSSSGWSQKRGTSMPSCSAARMTRVPLGTRISTPSMTTVMRSTDDLDVGAGSGTRIARDGHRATAPANT